MTAQQQLRDFKAIVKFTSRTITSHIKMPNNE